MSNNEEYYLYLINKLLQGDISDDEKDLLMQLCINDEDRLLFVQYLISQVNEKELLESEIVYEKTKPHDLIQSETIIYPPKSSRNKIILFKTLAVAASVAIVLFSYFYYSPISNENVEEWQVISTKRGERKFLTFQDGTEIWLNNESELKVLKGFGIKHRKMALLGEGYFSVAKNSSFPLYIQTKDTEVKVLGTVFNLSSYPESEVTTTSLLEGKVALKVVGHKDDKEIIMYPGDQVMVSKYKNVNISNDNTLLGTLLSEPITYKKVDLKDAKVADMLWVDNQLVFDDNTLAEMTMKLSRWYNKEIVIQNPKLLDISFSGTFQERECTQVLDILKKTGLKIDYQMKNDTIYIN